MPRPTGPDPDDQPAAAGDQAGHWPMLLVCVGFCLIGLGLVVAGTLTARPVASGIGVVVAVFWGAMAIVSWRVAHDTAE